MSKTWNATGQLIKTYIENLPNSRNCLKPSNDDVTLILMEMSPSISNKELVAFTWRIGKHLTVGSVGQIAIDWPLNRSQLR